MAVNAQYSDPPFGLGGDYASTGAPGTPGSAAESAGGAVVGSPVVTVGPYASSQIPVNVPRIDVTQGDTCAMTSDAPVPLSGDPMTGVSLADITQTGAGQGSPRDLSPNAMDVPSAGAQLQAARRPS
jgi:hypothetical protein